MLACRRSNATRFGSSALVLMAFTGLLFVSGGALAQTDQTPYVFLKGQTTMARIDTTTGQVSTVRSNGDGGWKPIGSPPSDEGKLSRPGRYGLLKLQPQRAAPQRGHSGVLEPLIRFDRATGRAWIGEMTQFTHWREFGQEDPGPPPEQGRTTTSNSVGGKNAGGENAPKIKVLSKKTLDEAGGLSKADVEVFVEAINKPGLDSDVRVWATLQLGAVDPDLSVPPLLDALGSDDPLIVAAAVQALAQTGVASVIPQILKLEDHPDPAVREAVAAAVTRVD